MLAQGIVEFMLSRQAITTSSEVYKYARCTESSMCDNCCFQSLKWKNKKIEISTFVKDLLLRCCNEETVFKVKTIKDNVVKMMSSDQNETNAIFESMLEKPEGKSYDFSLLSDLFRCINGNEKAWLDQLRHGKVSMYLQHSKLLPLRKSQPSRISWFDLDFAKAKAKRPELIRDKSYIWPYLIQFEGRRLRLDIDRNDEDRLSGKLSGACEWIFNKANKKPAPYIRFLQLAEKVNPFSPISLSFHAELSKNGDLELSEPERAVDRRIFRMYGSDRFLEVSVAPGVSDETIKSFFSCPVFIGSRVFRFFWFKKEDGIRAVLFAERGPDLDEVSVSHVRERCIPQLMNPELTLGKWVKRIKLSFSTTTVGCILPPGSVSILPNFNEDSIAEIDGAGLLSGEALEAIWIGYMNGVPDVEKCKSCPYSGFQGRLAG
jgi:RNA dependent RNA polymerase